MKVPLTLVLIFLVTTTWVHGATTIDDSAQWVDRLCFAVYKKLDFYHDTVTFSQLSVAMALGMILKGARGQTADEIEQVLYVKGLPVNVVHDKLSKLLIDEVERPRDNITLTVSNLALLSKDIPVKADYVDFIKNKYQASFDSVNFAENEARIVTEANQFVGNRTKGLVPNVISTNFDPKTQLALVSTAYFKAQWKYPFPRENTHRAPFYNMDGTVSQVDMMHVVAPIRSCRLPDEKYTIYEIFYNGKGVWHSIIPDDPFGDDNAVANLTSAKIAKCFSKAQPMKANIYFPKFRLDYSPDMTALISSLGAPTMFDKNKADLSGITDRKPFAVSKILSRVVLNFNEDGVDAEAAKTVSVKTSSIAHESGIKTLRWDHPFGFGITDMVHRMVVYAAIVNKL